MRQLATVVRTILMEVPNEFGGRREMEKRLTKIIQDCAYTAPEVMYVRWNEAAAVLNSLLGEPDTGWKNKVAQIFNDTQASIR